MLNDREEQYENHEESEYHFSDEEVNYEVETESPKPVVAAEPKESIGSRLTRSKRMLMSIGVFAVLVFVVYKMVTPATSPTSPAAGIDSAMVAQQAPQQKIPVSTAPAEAVKTSPPPPAQTNVISVRSATPVVKPSAQVAATPNTPPPVAVTQPPAQATPQPQVTQAAQSNVNTLMTENQKLMGQLQTEYAQKLNDYAAQNKLLQDQVQELNTRMATVESEMNQLMQVLSRVGQTPPPAAPAASAPPAATPPAQADATSQPDVKLPYSVQAIIPGRAWLRADNGETVTVAEGDVIKDIGRITKIDPYDGVVEINTGNKVVSLSYGNGV
ncbi:MAG: hypothetical protein EPO11_07010 [Gammaproteobacteria bacterium]|nr:MAG: hypothetical protein EPO11_07010 [Gammaproteobacteria bacterium]